MPFQAVYGAWNTLWPLSSTERTYRSAIPRTIWFARYSVSFGGKTCARSRGERKWRSKNFIGGVLGYKQQKQTFTEFHKKERTGRLLWRWGSSREEVLCCLDPERPWRAHFGHRDQLGTRSFLLGRNAQGDICPAGQLRPCPRSHLYQHTKRGAGLREAGVLGTTSFRK